MDWSDKIAVIIVNYNAGSYLKQCLIALKRQTFSPARVFLVDNASNDGSLLEIDDQIPGLEILPQKENIGFAAANNLAVGLAEDCRWVAMLNPDAFPHPDWLAQLLQAAKNHPEFSFFGSRLLQYPGNDSLDGTGDVYHVGGLAWRRDHGQRNENINCRSEEIFAPCAAAAMYRRDIFLDAGGFDNNFFCYFEDVDLAFRLRLAGHGCYYVADAVVEHVGSATTGKKSDFAVYHGHRNLVWTYFKNMPNPLFWFYLPQHLLANIATLLWFTLRGQATPIIKAKRDALKGWLRVLKQRKTIQRGIKIHPDELKKLMAHGVLTPFTHRGFQG